MLVDCNAWMQQVFLKGHSSLIQQAFSLVFNTCDCFNTTRKNAYRIHVLNHVEVEATTININKIINAWSHRSRLSC